MPTINPTPQTINPPSETALFDAMRRDFQLSINCVRIGEIQSFSPGDASHGPMVSVKIAQQQVTSIDEAGSRTLADFPILVMVPLLFPNGGGFTLTFPVSAGDECLLFFNDRELDNWLVSGAGQAPTTGRVHDLADAIAVVGLRSNKRGLAGISAANAQLRSDDGQTLIDVGPGKIQLIADEIVIHGRNKTTFDAGGTGFVYQPNQIDTYTDGVPSNHHNPTPPEVPT